MPCSRSCKHALLEPHTLAVCRERGRSGSGSGGLGGGGGGGETELSLQRSRIRARIKQLKRELQQVHTLPFASLHALSWCCIQARVVRC